MFRWEYNLDKLVSVVIPTHFRADRLVKAVQSARNQTWKNIEIIVVSDGFDSNTEDVINKLKIEDLRIKFYSYDPSQGGNHARNVGIQNASGDYIAFLDDDDIWYPNKIEKQMELFSNDEKVGLVGCGINVINTIINKNYTNIFTYHGDLSKEILYSNLIGSTSCVMVKKSVLDQCGVFDEEMPARQDHDLWIRICQKYKVDCVKEVLLDYYVYQNMNGSQQVSKSLEKYIRSHELTAKKYSNLYNKLTKLEYKRLMGMRYLGIASRAHETGNSRTAIQYAKMSIKEYMSAKSIFYLLFSWIPYNILVRARTILK